MPAWQTFLACVGGVPFTPTYTVMIHFGVSGVVTQYS
jgi:hypothetical protein